MSNANRMKLRITAAAMAAGALAVAGTTLATSASAVALAAPAKPAAAQQTGYTFTTLDDAKDLTFNQLLGINNEGVIAGYLGSGAQGHPNKGYLLFPPYGQGNYANENFPGSVQTQVTGLNDKGVTVGFWSSMNNATMVNDNHGFYKINGHQFHTADFPTGSPFTPPVDQLLGVNNGDIAVGFYTDAVNVNHGYKYNINTKHFSSVTDPNAPTSLAAAAINNNGDIAGFYIHPGNGLTDGFFKAGGKFIDLAFPGALNTFALGVNDHDEVVGVTNIISGGTVVTHGFTWKPGHGFTVVDDPNGIGTTTINGVNNKGDLVGFYVDGNGNTDGFLAKPGH
jgi:hypothetical protein